MAQSMTRCAMCEYDPALSVAGRWEFELVVEVQSANAHIVNGRVASWAYRKRRDEWTMLMRVASRHIPGPTGKRRITLTRLYSGRQREWDRDNLVGGAKLVLDAAVKAGILIDDAKAFAEVHYLQERGERRGTRVLVEAIG